MMQQYLKQVDPEDGTTYYITTRGPVQFAAFYSEGDHMWLVTSQRLVEPLVQDAKFVAELTDHFAFKGFDMVDCGVSGGVQ